MGLVVPFVNRWFFGEVISTVETQLRESNFDLLLYNLGTEQGRARFFDIMPARKRVDGLVVASLVLDEGEYGALGELDLPVALLGLEHEASCRSRSTTSRPPAAPWTTSSSSATGGSR